MTVPLPEWWPYLARAALGTLGFLGLLWVISFPIGFVLSMLSTSRRSLARLLTTFAELLYATPQLAILFLFYYSFQFRAGISLSPYASLLVVLGAFTSVVAASILLDEMQQVGSRFSETVQGACLSETHFVRRIVVPVATRNAVPRMVGLAVTTVHLSMFGSLIGVSDLFREAQRLNAEVMDPVRVFSAMALGYVLICAPLFVLGRYLKRLRL